MSAELAELETDGWELVDGEVAAEQYPETFRIPPEESRRNVRSGDLVKLRFLFRADEPDELPGTESMHVRVTSVDGEVFAGTLEDVSVLSDVVNVGQQIRFEPRHIVAIVVRPDDPRHPLYSPSVVGRFLKRLRAMFRGNWDQLG